MENKTNPIQHLNRISALDGLKGIASIIIVAFHVLGVGVLDISNNLQFIPKYFAFGVAIFLIISAFSLSLNYDNKINSSSSFLAYFLNRYARITPLFLFMMIVWIFINNINFKTSVTYNDIIINIFYLYNFIPSKYAGIIWASWPIGVLFIFYLVFPLIIIVNKSIKSAIVIQCIFIMIGYSIYSFFNNLYYPPAYPYSCFFSQLPIFGFGIIMYYLFKSSNLKKSDRILISIIGLIGIFIAFYVLSKLFSYELKILVNDKINNNIGYYYIMGLFMAFFIYSQCLYSIPVIDNIITRFYGKISYSLYLLHPFVIYKLKAFYQSIYSIDGISKDIAYFLCFIMTLIIVTPLAYLFNKIFEERASFMIKTLLKPVFKI